MSRRLMALSWLSVFVVTGLLGHTTALKLHATPAYANCPLLSNTNCQGCVVYIDPLLGGQVNCQITTGSYRTCVTGTSGSCVDIYSYTCSGVENTKADCTGMTIWTACSASDFNTCSKK